jgi:hypothetical protein
MRSEFPSAVPEIPVRSIAAAAAYYQGSLGFTLDWGDEELGLAGISRGNCRMFLANQQYRKQYGNIGLTLTWLNLDSKEEVDELYRVWSFSNAKVISAPESKPGACTSSRQRIRMGISFVFFMISPLLNESA